MATGRCIPLLYAELYERAIEEALNVLEFDDGAFVAHWVIALGHFFQGQVTEARKAAEEAFRRAPWNAAAVGFLAGLLSQTGDKERAENLIVTMRGTIPVGMIHYHLICCETDAAIDWYERAIQQRHTVQLAAAGLIKPLRSSPRWPKLARMMNLPETS